MIIAHNSRSMHIAFFVIFILSFAEIYYKVKSSIFLTKNRMYFREKIVVVVMSW
jgi:hypothetical protein